jgi:hypothetical protein
MRGRTGARVAVIAAPLLLLGPCAPQCGPAEPGAPTSPAAPSTTAPTRTCDPSQFGVGGTGGAPSAAALALLADPRVTISDAGRRDLAAGRTNPRVIDLLADLAVAHTITVSALASDHDRFTTGGTESVHWFGRGVDIAAVDGVIVDVGNAAARELAQSLSTVAAPLRPTEVGSPFSIAAPGFFTDADHPSKIHVGYDADVPAGYCGTPTA